MNTYTFQDASHREAFYDYLIQDKTLRHDLERHALFYLLALSPVSRSHIHEIYDFGKKQINLDCLEQAWITHSTHKLIAFAFNLYNNYEVAYTPLELFSNMEYLPFFYQALSIRFNLKN